MPYIDAERERQNQREWARMRRAAEGSRRSDDAARILSLEAEVRALQERLQAAEARAPVAPQEAPGRIAPAVPSWPHFVQVMEFVATALRGLPPGSRARLDKLAEILAGRLQAPPAYVLGIVRAAWPERVVGEHYCTPGSPGR